jgi:hypothetical protein
MIAQIGFLNSLEYSEPYQVQGETIKSISPLSRINIFIGANNSGEKQVYAGTFTKSLSL